MGVGVTTKPDIKNYVGWFLFLFLFSAAGIILHELGHHLFGIPSEVSLARNWPLVPVTGENQHRAIIGSLAGPTVNLLLIYFGMLVFIFLKGLRTGILSYLAGLFALANIFLVVVPAVVNLLLDLTSGNWINDLQVVSRLTGINVFVLPVVFVALSIPAIMFFWCNMKILRENTAFFIITSVVAGFGAGAFLSLLDTIFHIRYTFV